MKNLVFGGDGLVSGFVVGVSFGSDLPGGRVLVLAHTVAKATGYDIGDYLRDEPRPDNFLQRTYESLFLYVAKKIGFLSVSPNSNLRDRNLTQPTLPAPVGYFPIGK